MQRKEPDNWLNEVDGFNARMAELDVTPSISLSDKAGLAILAHARFPHLKQRMKRLLF